MADQNPSQSGNQGNPQQGQPQNQQQGQFQPQSGAPMQPQAGVPPLQPQNPFGPFPGGPGSTAGPGPVAGAGAPPPPPPEDTTPANYQIGQHLPKVINVKIPAHQLNFDDQYFLHLLAGSISLTRDEKKRIVDSIPKLKQAQIDELIRIFEEERRKFAELSAKHVDQLKKLEKQHWAEWQDLEIAQKADQKKDVDQAQAEEIRKKLGL